MDDITKKEFFARVGKFLVIQQAAFWFGWTMAYFFLGK